LPTTECTFPESGTISFPINDNGLRSAVLPDFIRFNADDNTKSFVSVCGDPNCIKVQVRGGVCTKMRIILLDSSKNFLPVEGPLPSRFVFPGRGKRGFKSWKRWPEKMTFAGDIWVAVWL
jgi:hypothetical protein